MQFETNATEQFKWHSIQGYHLNISTGLFHIRPVGGSVCLLLVIYSVSSLILVFYLSSEIDLFALETYNCRQKSTSKFCATQSDSLYFVAEFYTKERWTQSEFLFQVETSKTYDRK